MTLLKKPVRRETNATYQGRHIVIQLEPPSIVRLREKGRRLWYETSVEAIYALAAKQHAERMRKEKKERSKEAK